jgi:hypothetical protein
VVLSEGHNLTTHSTGARIARLLSLDLLYNHGSSRPVNSGVRFEHAEKPELIELKVNIPELKDCLKPKSNNSFKLTGISLSLIENLSLA